MDKPTVIDKEQLIDYILSEDCTFRQPTNEELSVNEHILGVMTGTHFLPEGCSRNGRWYSKQLWTEQLEKPWVKEKTANRTMYGTIGHDAEIDDKALREGIPSHYTTNLQIVPTGNPKQPWKGIAETYIMNTPVGRLLKTYLGSGSKLYVSSRADGRFIPGAMHTVAEDGRQVPVVDSNTYRLERFDFVTQPGFLEACPELKEELDETVIQKVQEAYEKMEQSINNTVTENNHVDNIIKENSMNGLATNDIMKKAGDVVIQVSDDNQIVMTKLKSTDSSAKDTDMPANKGNTLITEPISKGVQNVSLSDKDQKTFSEEIMSDFVAQNNALKEEVKRLTALLEDKEDARQTLDISKKIVTDGQKQMGADEPLSDDENIKALLSTLQDVKDYHEEYGTPEDLAEAKILVDTLSENADLLDYVFDIAESSLEFQNDYDSLDVVANTLDVVGEQYSAVGGVEEMQALIESVDEISENADIVSQRIRLSRDAERLFEDYGDAATIATMLDDYLDLIQEHGETTEIRKNLKFMETINNSIQKLREHELGNFDIILNVLQEAETVKMENKALVIAENTGINSNVILEHLRSGLDERQIIDLYNKSFSSPTGKYLTMSENVSENSLKFADSDSDVFKTDVPSYRAEVSQPSSRIDRMLSLASGI